MEGEITSRDLTEEELLEIKNRRLDNKVIGEKLDNGGIVVSDSFAKDFMEGKSSKTLDDLQNMDAEDIRKLSGNIEGTKELRRGIGGLQPRNFQAHHVIPRELGQKFKEFFKKIGFNIEDGAINGIGVPPNKTVLEASKEADEFDNYAFHQGSHPDYTELIESKIIRIRSNYNNGILTESEALDEIKSLADKAKNAIKNGNGKTVNQIKF